MVKKLLLLIAPFAVVLLLGGVGALESLCTWLADVVKSIMPFVGDAVHSSVWTTPQFWIGGLLLVVTIAGIHFTKKVVKLVFSIGSVIALLMTLSSFGMIG